MIKKRQKGVKIYLVSIIEYWIIRWYNSDTKYKKGYIEMDEIKEYLDDILEKQLKELTVSDEYVIEIKKNIQNQMMSLLKHWNDFSFREAVLQIGLEEGKFYHPQAANIKIRCFVVVTIRNSLLETIASVDCKQAGLEKAILDEDIIKITKTAIIYFNTFNFRKLAEKSEDIECEDIYGRIASQYKLAWRALKELSTCTTEEKYYAKETKYTPISLMNLRNVKYDKIHSKKDMGMHIDYQSGISPYYSENLLNNISRALNSVTMPYFYTDSFKYISRNVEKLFQVIEILLQRNKVLLTNNYYIASNYVAKRTKILKAAHSREEIERNLKQSHNISKKHAEALKKYY